MSTRHSHIGWTGPTWNPVTGCTKISDGCLFCYIERTVPFRVQKRTFDQPGIGGTTGVTLHPSRLAGPTSPRAWRSPERIFVCSMADLFHDEVPDEFIGGVFETMAACPQHTFQVLTKRPARARSLLTRWGEQGAAESWAGPGTAVFRRHDMVWCGPVPWPLPNVWIGTSVENQHWADIRVPVLLDTPAAVRFVSAEPLLEQVTLQPYLHPGGCHTLENGESFPNLCTFRSCGASLSWVIGGGESGRLDRIRPAELAWFEDLDRQCRAAGVPYFHKQHGSVLAKQLGLRDPKGATPDEWPTPFPQDFPLAAVA